MRSMLIYSTQFFMTSALGVIFVFLEDVQTMFGLVDWQVGLIAGAGFGASFLAQILLSPLADRGLVVPLAIVAIVAGVIGPVGFAFGSSVAILAVSRGLTGIAIGLFSLLARKALIGVDTTGGGAKLGILLSITVAGFIAGPLIGAVLEPVGFEAPFILVSAMLAITGVPATIAILRSDIASAPVQYSDLAQLLARPKVQAAMLVQVIVFGYIGVFDATVDRFLTDLGVTTNMVALVIVFVGAPMLVLPRLAGNLAEAKGGATVMLPALLILVPAMLGYAFVGGIVAAIIFGVMHGSGESISSVSSQVLVLEVTGAERAAVGSALLDAAGLATAAVAAFVSPLGYGAYGQTFFIYIAIIGAVLGAAATLRVRSAWD